MSLTHEPFSEPLSISTKQFFLDGELYRTEQLSPVSRPGPGSPRLRVPGFGVWALGFGCDLELLHDTIGLKASGSGFHVPGSRFRVPCSGFQVPGSRFRVPCSGFHVPGSRFRVPCSGFQGPGSMFRVPCSGFQVPGSGFGCQGPGVSSHLTL